MVVVTRSQTSMSGVAPTNSSSSRKLPNQHKDHSEQSSFEEETNSYGEEFADNAKEEDDTDTDTDSTPIYALCHFTQSEIESLKRKIHRYNSDFRDIELFAHLVPYTSSPSQNTEERELTQEEMEERLLQVFRANQIPGGTLMFFADRLSLQRVPEPISNDDIQVLCSTTSLSTVPAETRRRLKVMKARKEPVSGRGVAKQRDVCTLILAAPAGDYLLHNASIIAQNRDLYALHSPALFDGQVRQYDESLEGYGPNSYFSDENVYEMALKRGINFGRISLKRWRECALMSGAQGHGVIELVGEKSGFVADPTWDGKEYVELLEACKQKLQDRQSANERTS